MSQSLYLLSNKVHGCGVPQGRCLPCSGVSGRTAAVYSCSPQGRHKIHSRVKIRQLKCASVGASFVCEARRSADFSRQNKHGFSRSKNQHNEGRDSFENFEEDISSSKDGPLISLSRKQRFQATAAPGPREKEIVELFRKVQARLRERAAAKEEKKFEASQGQVKENGTVDSLLKLLRKHSVEREKRSSGGGTEKDSSLDQLQDSSQYNGGQSIKLSDLDSAPKDESQEAKISSVTRPSSNFQRRSPIPRLSYQPVFHDENGVNAVSSSSEVRGKDQVQIGGLNLDSEPDPDTEPELDPKHEHFYQDVGIADLSEDDYHDAEQTYIDEHVDEQKMVQYEDLSALKLPELRALAKSRGLKGFSKMKKAELVELLTGS